MKLDSGLRVVACLDHIAHAVVVGFQFVGLAVLRHRQLCSQCRTAHNQAGIVVVTECDAKPGNSGVDQHALLHSLNAVAGCGMDNFVAQNRCKLCLVLQLHQQPPVNSNLA